MRNPKYLTTDYFGAMDRPSYFVTLDEQAPIHTYQPSNAQGVPQSTLTPRELGATLNPMQNQLQALQAKIREGASKMEFEFMGRQKGNSQQSTPESYGKEEREMMRALAQLNDIRTSTHATPQVSGLAGFGERGFNKAQQHATIHEVQRAIDFAKDASTGGAVVLHTGEWQRPISTYYGEKGRNEQMGFSAYDDEDLKAELLVVDKETGQFIQGISKDKKIFVPQWHTAQSLFGYDSEQEGTDVEGNPTIIRPDDYIDQYGRKIDETNINQLFRRVPVYNEYDENKGDVRFATREMGWEELEEETRRYNEKYNASLTPEKYFAQQQLDTQILQAKGQSLYYLQQYNTYKEEFEALRTAYDFYNKLDESLSDEEKWQIMMQRMPGRGSGREYVRPITESIPEYLKRQLQEAELSMRHIHQSSSSADAQAADLLLRRENIVSMEEYGLKETGKALAKLAEEAMDKSKEARKMRHPDEKWEDLFIAPENWHPNEYGSHPDELLKIVRAGREEFVKRLKDNRQMDEEQAKELAEKHIKTTFDIGHLNMWRSMMKREKGESEEQFQERFNKWVFGHLEKLHKEKAIGHLHLTDNFGYNDEHLHIGQGNAPVKEFVKWMEERGYTDFIIEAGSFNPQTIVPDAWSYLGASHARNFASQFPQGRIGVGARYQAPNSIVGSYVPSNEWTLWTGIPLE